MTGKPLGSGCGTSGPTRTRDPRARRADGWMRRAARDRGRTRRARAPARRAWHALAAETDDPAEFARLWHETAQRMELRRGERAIARHNRNFPVEARLPMDPRTRDFVKIDGRSYEREPLDAEWILAAGRQISPPRGRRAMIRCAHQSATPTSWRRCSPRTAEFLAPYEPDAPRRASSRRPASANGSAVPHENSWRFAVLDGDAIAGTISVSRTSYSGAIPRAARSATGSPQDRNGRGLATAAVGGPARLLRSARRSCTASRRARSSTTSARSGCSSENGFERIGMRATTSDRRRMARTCSCASLERLRIHVDDGREAGAAHRKRGGREQRARRGRRGRAAGPSWRRAARGGGRAGAGAAPGRAARRRRARCCSSSSARFASAQLRRR